MNWVDDAAVKFLKKIGVTKKVAEKLNSKKTRKALTEATDELTKIEDKAADKLNKEIAEQAGDYATKEAKKATKKKGNDVKLMMAQGICAAAKAPNVAVNINKAFRIAQYAKLGYTVLTAADAIKKGEATPEMVNNVATILTQSYTKSDGTIKKPATDAKLMKYTMGLGTAGSSSSYIPGVGGTLATYLGVVNSEPVKMGCDLIGSTAAEVGVDVFDGLRAGLGPIGWAWVGGELLIEGLLTFDTVQEKLSSVMGTIVQTSIDAFTKWVDMKALAEYFLGNKTKGATGTDVGDITGVGLSNSMADQASYTGNAPLTVQQKVAFDEQIVQPERIALAEEDRLTHSPFDISSPNTFLGSIAIRFVPYLGMASSPLAFVSAISSISTSSLFNLFNPSAYAKNIIDENKCTQNSVLANEKDIAVGPACDVQYGVPTDYMGIEPDQVASELSASGDIDEDGKVKSNSELQDWIDTCNQASIINTKECTVDSRQRALYNLYQIDKRTVDGMDEDPDKTTKPTSTSTASTSTSVGSAVGEPEFNQAQPAAEGGDDVSVWKGLNNGALPDNELVTLSFSSERMHKQAAAAMEEMNKAYKSETGSDLGINEAYRDCETQIAYADPNSSRYQGGLAKPAPPCSSNHGWGLAADISVGGFDTPVYNWLTANAHKYGFVHPKWAERDGSKPEAWHWEYARRVAN